MTCNALQQQQQRQQQQQTLAPRQQQLAKRPPSCGPGLSPLRPLRPLPLQPGEEPEHVEEEVEGEAEDEEEGQEEEDGCKNDPILVRAADEAMPQYSTSSSTCFDEGSSSPQSPGQQQCNQQPQQEHLSNPPIISDGPVPPLPSIVAGLNSELFRPRINLATLQASGRPCEPQPSQAPEGHRAGNTMDAATRMQNGTDPQELLSRLDSILEDIEAPWREVRLRAGSDKATSCVERLLGELRHGLEALRTVVRSPLEVVPVAIEAVPEGMPSPQPASRESPVAKEAAISAAAASAAAATAAAAAAAAVAIKN